MPMKKPAEGKPIGGVSGALRSARSALPSPIKQAHFLGDTVVLEPLGTRHRPRRGVQAATLLSCSFGSIMGGARIVREGRVRLALTGIVITVALAAAAQSGSAQESFFNERFCARPGGESATAFPDC